MFVSVLAWPLSMGRHQHLAPANLIICALPPPPRSRIWIQCMNSNHSNHACHPPRITSTRHLILYNRPWANTGNICDTSCLQSSEANHLNAKTFRLFPHIRTSYIVCLRILLWQRYSESRRPGVLPVGTTPRGHSSHGSIHGLREFQELYQAKSWNGREPWGRRLCE